MKFECSRVPNCCEEGNAWLVKGGEEHAKVYPFIVSFPPYASWKSYVRNLLNQLKSCPHCKAAADAFPISTLPKVHTLSNGKVRIFKGLTSSACDRKLDSSRSDNSGEDDKSEKDCHSPLMGSDDEPIAHHQQPLSTFCELIIEEYDMVSIDPNCPKHGRYSLTAWLQKEGTKVEGMQDRGICQIYPKTKISENYCTRRIKQVQKRDGTKRSISSKKLKPLHKLYGNIVDKDVVEMPSRVEVPSTLKKHKSENLKFTPMKQIETNTTTNPSILLQKQTNILSTHSHQKDSVLGPQHKKNSNSQMADMNKKIQFISKEVLSESNDNNKRTNAKIMFMEREKCETPFGKDFIPISNKSLRKCPENTYASQYRRMCHLKGLNYRNCFDSCNDELVEGNSKKIKNGVESKLTIESKISFVTQECVYEENNKLFNGTTTKLKGDDTQNRSTKPTEFTREEQLMAHDLFEMKEQAKQLLEWVEHRKNKLVNETQINIVGNEPSTCTPTWFTIKEHQMAHEMIAIEEEEQTRRLKCVQHENDNLVDETRMNLVDESSKCAPIWFSIDEHQMLSGMCNLKELGQCRRQLECVQHEMIIWSMKQVHVH